MTTSGPATVRCCATPDSGGGTAEEVITLNNPTAGNYELYANLFAIASDTTLTVMTNYWTVGTVPARNFTATPASQSVSIGSTATVTLNWTGLTAGLRYLGTVVFNDGTSTIGRTVVTVSG